MKSQKIDFGAGAGIFVMYIWHLNSYFASLYVAFNVFVINQKPNGVAWMDSFGTVTLSKMKISVTFNSMLTL